MMTMMNVYTIYTAKRRSGTAWNKWGPSILVIIASVLIMLEPTRHLWMDYHVLGSNWAEYQESCDADWFYCLSAVGWLITIGATYIGFTLLLVGSLWNANIMSKLRLIRQKWNALIHRHREARQLATHQENIVINNKSDSIISHDIPPV